MKTVQAICETYLMYACFFALAMIVGVFTLAYCWKQLRRIFSLGSIQGTFVSIIVVFLTLYGGSKSLFKFEKGLKDDGSYSTNDTVYISWIKSGEVADIPNDSTLYVEKRLSTDTEGEFVPFHTNTVGAYELTLNVADATNYDYNIWYEYIEPPAPISNWFSYYAKSTQRKENIIPWHAKVVGIEGDKKYVLNGFEHVNEIPPDATPDGKLKQLKCLVVGTSHVYDGTGYGPNVKVTSPSSGAKIEYSYSSKGPWLDSILLTNVVDGIPIFCKVSAEGYNSVTQGVICAITPAKIEFIQRVYDGWYGDVYSAYGHITTPSSGGIVQYSTNKKGPWTTNKVNFTQIGNYTVYIRYSAENYATTTTVNNVIISKYPLVFTSESAHKFYDGTALTNHNISIATSFGGLPRWPFFNEGFTCKVTGSQTDAGSSLNTFEIIPINDSTKLSNYDITKSYGTLTVAQSYIDISAEPFSVKYDGQYHDVPVTSTASFFSPSSVLYFIDPDEQRTYKSLNLKNVTNVNVFAVASSPNYYSDIISAPLEISKRDITLTSSNESKDYDGVALTNMSDIVISGDGFATNEGAEYTFTGSQLYPGASPNSFDYILDKNTLARNYNITKKEGMLTVSGELPDMVYTTTDVSTEYDGKTYSAQVNVTVPSSDVSVFYSASMDGPWSNNPIEFKNVTNITTYAKIIAAGYSDITITLNNIITAKKVSMSSPSATKKYDGTSLTSKNITSTGFVSGEGCTYNVAGEQLNAGSSPNIFTYTLNENTLAENYIITKTEGTLTVTPRNITLTSGSATKPFDANFLTNNEMTVDGDGFAPNESAEYTFTGSQIYDGESPNTFTYTINTGIPDNYNVTTNYGTLAVTGKPTKWEVTVPDNTTYYFAVSVPQSTGVHYYCDNEVTNLIANTHLSGKTTIKELDPTKYTVSDLIGSGFIDNGPMALCSAQFNKAGTYTIAVESNAVMLCASRVSPLNATLADIDATNETFITAKSIATFVAITNCAYVTKLIQWSDELKYAFFTFTGCTNLTGGIPEWPKKLIGANATFAGCQKLTGEIPEWPASVETVNLVYAWCYGLTGSIPKWEGTSIVTAYGTYNWCYGLTGSIPKWNSQLHYIRCVYYNCYQLTTPFTTSQTELIPTNVYTLQNGVPAYEQFYGCFYNLPTTITKYLSASWRGNATNESRININIFSYIAPQACITNYQISDNNGVSTTTYNYSSLTR